MTPHAEREEEKMRETREWKEQICKCSGTDDGEREIESVRDREKERK